MPYSASLLSGPLWPPLSVFTRKNVSLFGHHGEEDKIHPVRYRNIYFSSFSVYLLAILFLSLLHSHIVFLFFHLLLLHSVLLSSCLLFYRMQVPRCLPRFFSLQMKSLLCSLLFLCKDHYFFFFTYTQVNANIFHLSVYRSVPGGWFHSVSVRRCI